MNQLAFGGLTIVNDESIQLRATQINDGVVIHTCNDYGQSLEVIREAVKVSGAKPKVMLKVYYRYPDIENRRYRSMLNQIQEAVTRMGVVPAEFSIQFCCYFPPDVITGERISEFCVRINSLYKVSSFFFECYGIYNYQWENFQFLQDKLGKTFSIGVAGYQNFLNRVFCDADLDALQVLNIPIAQIGFLGKTSKDPLKLSSSIAAIDYESSQGLRDDIDINIAYLKKNILKSQYSLGITAVSSLSNYYNLKARYERVSQLDHNEAENIIEQLNHESDVHYFVKDHYCGKHSFSEYCSSPGIILQKLRRRAMLAVHPSLTFDPFSLT